MQHSGSATSSTTGTSPEATLTSEASLTCDPMTSADTPRPISSPGLEDGRSPSGLPAGPMTDLFGQALAPASLSVPPARARRPMTNATCGLRGYLSSPSAALQSSLESRLKRRLDGAGSTLFSLTWNRKATPAGRPYFQLAASGRRTSGSDFGSWPTPVANDTNRSLEAWQAHIQRRGRNPASELDSLQVAVQLASWPTPNAQEFGIKDQERLKARRQECKAAVMLSGWATPRSTEAGHSTGNPERAHDGKSRLEDQVFLPHWATPTSRDWKDGGSSLENVPVNALMGRQALLANWPTPRAAEKNDRQSRHGKDYLTMTGAAKLSAWSTPRANKWGFPDAHGSQEQPLPASGPTQNVSHAQTEKPGQLDPDHSRWVMGYETAHLNCAPTETPSFLKSRRSSSARLKTRA